MDVYINNTVNPGLSDLELEELADVVENRTAPEHRLDD
jgi:hypothetical protein